MARLALVIDDEPLVASLLASSLSHQRFEVEVARSAGEARRLLDESDPDIAIIDLNLGAGPTGVDVANYVSTQLPHVGILLLTKYGSPELAGYDISALPESVGFLEKADIVDEKELHSAIEQVLARNPPQYHKKPLQGPLANLTATQLATLQLVASGYSTAEIARVRNTSTSAVEQVISSIYQRLGLASGGHLNPRAEAVQMFVEQVGAPRR